MKHYHIFKACFYCITGTDNNDDKNVVYRPILKNNKAGPWPTRRNTFALPKVLGPDDVISFSAIMTDGAQIFSISLVSGNKNPDYNNICYQIVVKMPCMKSKEIRMNEDNYVLSRLVYKGKEEILHGRNHEIVATDFFSDANINVKFVLEMRDKHVILSTYMGENNYFTTDELRHRVENLRFLTFDGDINKVKSLNFTFE